MKGYQGHRSYNAWNISLWISNDEPLYRFAIECLTRSTSKGNKPTLSQATRRFMNVFGNDKTPDGVPYTVTNVRLALTGLLD